MLQEDFAMLPGTTVRIARLLSFKSLRGCGGWDSGILQHLPLFLDDAVYSRVSLLMNRFSTC